MKFSNQLSALSVKTIVSVVLACVPVSLFAQSVDGIGLGKIVILEPGASDTSSPGIELSGDALISVEFTPVVHVHRFYYSKTETIQGPIISGGRHVVVVRHPIDNQTCYVDVILPGGTPKIQYEPRQLTYIYPDQRVQIKFTRSLIGRNCGAKIVYARGKGTMNQLRDWNEHVHDRLHYQISRSRLINGARTSAIETKKVVVGATEATAKFGEALSTSVNAILGNLPGVSNLKRLADERLGDREIVADRFSEFRSRAKSASDSFRTNR